jgi:hypothetical protein
MIRMMGVVPGVREAALLQQQPATAHWGSRRPPRTLRARIGHNITRPTVRTTQGKVMAVNDTTKSGGGSTDESADNAAQSSGDSTDAPVAEATPKDSQMEEQGARLTGEAVGRAVGQP